MLFQANDRDRPPTPTHNQQQNPKPQAMLGAVPLLVLVAAALLLSTTPTTSAFKLPLRMVGDSRPGQQVRAGGRMAWFGSVDRFERAELCRAVKNVCV